jgi:alcohol dehydrogenase class IV
MSGYDLAPTPRVAGGAGAHGRLGEIIRRLAGTKVLLVADPGLRLAGVIEMVQRVLAKSAVVTELFCDFSGDPTIEQTDNGANRAHDLRADIVIALGGGSALDLGKAIAAIAVGRRSALDYELCKTELPLRRLPTICLPTTSGTGSEATRTAVLTRADGAKTWLWGETVRPNEVVLDPQLTASLPASLTAATGIDALVHAVEAATNRNASAANNVYAYEAMRLVASHLERAVAEPGDIIARDALQRASFLAGIAIDNAGTAIAHNIGNAMGSLRKIHHGRAVGVAMLASLPWNSEGDDGRWADCATAIGAKPSATAFIDTYERLLRGSGVTISVADEFAGLSADILAQQMSRPENASMRASNQRSTSPDDLRHLAAGVLEQR